MARYRRTDEASFATIIQIIRKNNGRKNPAKISYFMVVTCFCEEFSNIDSYEENMEHFKKLYNRLLDYYIKPIECEYLYNETLTVVALGILFDADFKKLYQLYELMERYTQSEFVYNPLSIRWMEVTNFIRNLNIKIAKYHLFWKKYLHPIILNMPKSY